MITYGKAQPRGPLHILLPDDRAYCGVKRVDAVPRRSFGPDYPVCRRCELAHKAALKAIPPRSQAEIEAAQRAFRNEINDALWRLGIVP